MAAPRRPRRRKPDDGEETIDRRSTWRHEMIWAMREKLLRDFPEIAPPPGGRRFVPPKFCLCGNEVVADSVFCQGCRDGPLEGAIDPWPW